MDSAIVSNSTINNKRLLKCVYTIIWNGQIIVAQIVI